jgi:hypothetical protein
MSAKTKRGKTCSIQTGLYKGVAFQYKNHELREQAKANCWLNIHHFDLLNPTFTGQSPFKSSW